MVHLFGVYNGEMSFHTPLFPSVVTVAVHHGLEKPSSYSNVYSIFTLSILLNFTFRFQNELELDSQSVR
jgi:hypothetical protein